MFKDFVHLSVEYRGNMVFEHLNVGLCASQERAFKLLKTFFGMLAGQGGALATCSNVQMFKGANPSEPK